MLLNNIFMYLLVIHIMCGFTALFSAFGAILCAKGQHRHRICGRFFISAMTGVFITAVPLSLIKHNQFLFLIALFSYYLALSGWRYAKNRTGVATKFDWSISVLMLVIALVMLGIGLPALNTGGYQAIIMVVFGVIGGISALSDIKVYRAHAGVGKERIAKHLGAMLGATIATLTAFTVTNFHFHPQILLWLGPTILITPLIIWWKYKVARTYS